MKLQVPGGLVPAQAALAAVSCLRGGQKSALPPAGMSTLTGRAAAPGWVQGQWRLAVLLAGIPGRHAWRAKVLTGPRGRSTCYTSTCGVSLQAPVHPSRRKEWIVCRTCLLCPANASRADDCRVLAQPGCTGDRLILEELDPATCSLVSCSCHHFGSPSARWEC